MTSDEFLDVWADQRRVGRMRRRRSGTISFRYAPEWLSKGFAISQTLPLSSAPFSAEDGVAHRFFANLLPEGAFRERIVRDLRIPNTDYDLLSAIGGECAGALSILPSNRVPSEDFAYRPINESELAELVAGRGWTRLSSGSPDKRPRLSLAGAQDKCPVLLRDGRLFLPEHQAPSSHILKFELTNYRNVPAYETYTMHLARAIGLPVVNIDLRSTGKTRYTLIERYDRQTNDQGRVFRLHQEDFCQALGYGRERKYQSDGGPSFAQCLRLIRETSAAPAQDTLHLLRWQIFNVLAGNSDAHAKNISILYSLDSGVRLAPFYDLVCTRAIQHLDSSLAFDVGGERNPNQIQRKHWNKLAVDCDISSNFVLDSITDILTKIGENLSQVRQSFEDQFGNYPALQNVQISINKQCRRVARSLEQPRGPKKRL